MENEKIKEFITRYDKLTAQIKSFDDNDNGHAHEEMADFYGYRIDIATGIIDDILEYIGGI